MGGLPKRKAPVVLTAARTEPPLLYAFGDSLTRGVLQLNGGVGEVVDGDVENTIEGTSVKQKPEDNNFQNPGNVSSLRFAGVF